MHHEAVVSLTSQTHVMQHGLTSPLKIPQDILILEGWTESDFEIPVPQGWKLWLYDRSDERAGYSSQPIVRGQFLAVASPTSVMF